MRRVKKKNGSKGQILKFPTSTQGIDELRGEKEQSRKWKKEKRKETGSEPPTQLLGPFGHLLRPASIIQQAYSF